MISNGLTPSTRGREVLKRTMGASAIAALLAGCVVPPQQRVAPGEAPMVLGPAVRDNVTPLEAVLACFGDHVAATRQPPLVVSVGEVKDYTGKYSINEGSSITQGGALMVYSALGKLGGAVRVAERFDPVIAERELAYADRRQLGDGKTHQLSGPGGAQSVPWLPYFGGSISKSDYFIVGGITELNYNINSGGGEIGVNQVGVKARTFSQSVGVDLRIVDTKTLMIVKTVSLTKQFNGYEVGVNVFRFFNDDLFDINVGAKGQEPVQLGIRAALEEGVVRLVGEVTKVDPKPCLSMRSAGRITLTPAEDLRTVPNPSVEPAAATPVSGEAVNARSAATGTETAASVQIPFEFGAAVLTGEALALLDQVAAAAAQGPAQVVLVARDTENWAAGKRDALTGQRIGLVSAALVGRGIAAGAISVAWRPDPADTSIHRDGPGLQEIAKLRIESGSGQRNAAQTGPSPGAPMSNAVRRTAAQSA